MYIPAAGKTTLSRNLRIGSERPIHQHLLRAGLC